MITQRLRYFVVLAKLKNYTKAAEELYISQPALSKQIASLEEDLGVKLFERNTRKVRLTFAGQILLEQSKVLFDQEENIKHLLSIASKVSHVNLTIGNSTGWGYSYLPVVFAEFKKNNPNTGISMKQLKYSVILQNLSKHLIDIAIVRISDLSLLQNYSYTVIHTAKLAAFTNNNHRFAHHDSISFYDLVNETFVLLKESQNSPFINAVTQVTMNTGFVPNVAYEFDTIESVLFMLRTDLYVSLLADDIEAPDIHIASIAESQPTYLCAVWNKNDNNQYTRDLLAIMERVMGKGNS